MFDRKPMPIPTPTPIPFTAAGYKGPDGKYLIELSDRTGISSATYTEKNGLTIAFTSFAPAPQWGPPRR